MLARDQVNELITNWPALDLFEGSEAALVNFLRLDELRLDFFNELDLEDCLIFGVNDSEIKLSLPS